MEQKREIPLVPTNLYAHIYPESKTENSSNQPKLEPLAPHAMPTKRTTSPTSNSIEHIVLD